MSKFLKSTLVYRISIILLILAIFSGIALWFTRPAKADWFNDSWAYRIGLTFVNSGSADSNKYISVTLVTNTSPLNKLQAACNDARFTDANGKLLEYYQTNTCQAASTVYHVLMPSIPVGGNLIYFYYGNPTAVRGSKYVDFGVAQFTTGTVTQGSESVGPGPAGYWKFDEGNGTSAYDSTGHSLTGSFSGTPLWPNDKMCVSEKCLFFDGSSAYTDMGNNSALNFATNMTLEAWIFPLHKTGSDASLISRFQTNGSGYEFSYDIADLSLYLWNGGAVSSVPNAITENQWNYVVAVVSNNVATFYVNGVAKGGGAFTLTAGGGSVTFLVGCLPGECFLGFMDEVKAYPYARTSAQIKTDYNSRGAPDGTANRFGPDLTKSVYNDLVGYWPLNETASPAIDYSLGGNNGTWVGTAAATTGKFGNGIVLDGNSDYVETASSMAYAPDNWTVSAWIYPTALPSTGNLSSVVYSMGRAYVIWIWDDGSVGGCYYESGVYDWRCSVTAASAIQINNWYHIAYTYNDTTKLSAFYLNGVQKATYQADPDTGPDSQSANPLEIGTDQWDQYFSGRIDEVRVYKRDFSPGNVSNLYNWAPGPVGYWKFDENTGATVTDSSGNSTAGSLNNMISNPWVPGKFGSALKFGRTANNVNVGSAAILDDMTTMTAEAWIKPDASSNSYTIVSKSDDGSPSNGWLFFANMSNKYLAFYTACSGPASTYRTSSNNSLTANTWQHVAVTFTRSCVYSNIHFYINGIETSYVSEVSGGTNPLTDATQNVMIGYDLGGFDDFSGLIDDVKIYNYIRTPQQIIEDLLGGRDDTSSPLTENTAIVSYSFDEASSTSFTNKGSFGSAANATSSGVILNLDGKSYSAQQFRGVSGSYISSPKKALLASSGITYKNLSWGGWFKPTGSAVSKSLIVKPTEFRLTTSAGSAPSCSIYSGSWQTAAIGSTALPLNTWSHVQCVYDGANVQTFVDGVLVGTVSQTGNITSSSTTGLNLGWNYAGGEYFQGLIDEIKIYNYALPISQIKSNINSGMAQVMGSLSTNTTGIASNSASREFCVPGDTSTCNPPISWWKMDENTGTTANDSSAYGNTGTLSGAVWTPGKSGSGVLLNGNGSAINTTNAFDNRNPYTISFWVNPKTLSTDDTFFSTYNYSFSFAWTSSSTLALCNSGTCSPQATSTSNPLTTNAWQQVTVTYDGTPGDGSAFIYVNGRDVTSTSNVAEDNQANVLNIGAFDGSPANLYSVNGKMDDFRVYNYVRTPAQIAWDYNHGAPVAWYKFDECQGSIAYNSAVNGNGTAAGMDGTWSGSTTVGTCTTAATARGTGATGKFGSSLSFNGANSDYVSVADNDVFSFGDSTNDKPFSISAWVKMTDATQFTIAAKGGTSLSTEWSFDTMGGTGDQLELELWDTSAGNVIDAYSTNTVTNLENTWTHLVATYDGSKSSDGIKIYVNGTPIPITTNSGGSYTAMHNTATSLTIGGIWPSDATWKTFSNGQIDDVRIYNYGLTPQQVKTLYNGGSAVSF